MNVDDQLRQAGDRLNAELDQVPLPPVRQRESRTGRAVAVAAALTILIGGSVLWVTRGGDSGPVASEDAATSTSTTVDEVQPGPGDEPQPAGPVVVIAEGTFEGTDEPWRLSAFISEEDHLCMRLRGMSCGPIPSILTPLSSPSGTTSDRPAESRLSCAYGALHADVTEVILIFSDGSAVKPPIYGGGDLPASFYAYCWAGALNFVSVAAVDANGDTLAESTFIAPSSPTTNPSVCGDMMPIVVVLPTDFTGPLDGPSPDALTPVEDGQLIVHWTGRDGSVELRWPPNTAYTAGASWGSVSERDSDGTFLVVDPAPRMMVDDVEVEKPPTAGAYSFLPTDLMQGPCDAIQLDMYKSNSPGTPATRTGAGAGYGVPETAPEGPDLPAIAIYPDLPRPRELQLILETITVDTVPPVLECNAGKPIEGVDVPPNKSRTIVGGPAFDTPQQALEAMLETTDATTWPKTGYFELVEPDGSITYGNPIEDNSPDPRPDGGLIISISVTQAGQGWTVDSWTTSGC